MNIVWCVRILPVPGMTSHVTVTLTSSIHFSGTRRKKEEKTPPNTIIFPGQYTNWVIATDYGSTQASCANNMMYFMMFICDVIKQNESELKNIESLVLHFTVCSNLRAIFCWNPNQNWMYAVRSHRYSRFSAAQNNKIQRKLNTIICLKSILASSDSFCLITSHIILPRNNVAAWRKKTKREKSWNKSLCNEMRIVDHKGLLLSFPLSLCRSEIWTIPKIPCFLLIHIGVGCFRIRSQDLQDDGSGTCTAGFRGS